jgi:hypothetical protein
MLAPAGADIAAQNRGGTSPIDLLNKIWNGNPDWLRRLPNAGAKDKLDYLSYLSNTDPRFEYFHSE